MAGEKRTKDQEDSLLKEDVIIVDIEGTTTSINFVKETLFTYVRDNVKKYIDAKWEDQEFKSDLEKLKEQAKKDEEDKIEGLVSISGATDDEVKESLVKNVLWQMDGDRKTGALKQLQGHMWREAYDSGSIKGHVYEDVPECLKSWKTSGKKIYVYSSGSVEAQKLLFGHSEHGDLLEYFAGYFDTEVGMKQEASSYKNILNQIKVEASNVIFLTDVVKEARAAKEAGLSTVIMIREGNAPLSDAEKEEGFRTAKSFLELSFLNAAKRQKLDTPEVTKEKIGSEPVAEKMEVSEDVEMTDVSDKDSKSKVESKETKAEPEANEDKGTKDISPEKKTLETVVEQDEAMEIDGKAEAVKKVEETVANAKPVEEKKEAAKAEAKVESEKESQKATKEDVKPEEKAKTVDEEAKAVHKAEETVEKSGADETDKAVVADSKKMEVSEKPAEPKEQKIEVAKTEINSAAVDEAMEEAAPKVDSKPAKVADEKTETKTDESEKSSELANAKVVETETEKKKEENVKAESCAKTVEAEKSEAKSENVEGESEKVAKPIETSTKSEDAVTKSDEIAVNTETVKENGTSKTETETKAADNKDGSAEGKKTEPKVEETVATESKESKESVEKRSIDETKAEGSGTADLKKEAEAKESEAVKSGEEKESDKEGAKNDKKDEEPVKKVNGTTQNGDTTSGDNDKGIHTNGVNEPCTSDSADTKTNTDNLPQNREAESSTDASAESIKVKKVVDSTVADGAGEPDVVPPPAAVVAATS